ncbi:MAG: protein-L-isoaspartate O-methyltransferase [Proteobacteria bacterium]|nr:protein-L-isoaspartate O-methyltransferase [Pseudomonadota bacterium]
MFRIAQPSWTALCLAGCLLGASPGARADRALFDFVDFAAERRAMVETLRAEGITDEGVLWAMGAVPREQFVPAGYRRHFAGDHAIPLDSDTTESSVSRPLTVAAMSAWLELAPGDRVLEIGTGSGYGAAVLATMLKRLGAHPGRGRAGHLDTVELDPKLVVAARQRLLQQGHTNVRCALADGSLGLPGAAPFDRIIVCRGGR